MLHHFSACASTSYFVKLYIEVVAVSVGNKIFDLDFVDYALIKELLEVLVLTFSAA